jgi:hypothetical protein
VWVIGTVVLLFPSGRWAWMMPGWYRWLTRKTNSTGQPFAVLAYVRGDALAEHPEADQASHDQVNGNEVIEKTRKYEDEDSHDKSNERWEMRTDGHSHSPVLLEKIVMGGAAGRLRPVTPRRRDRRRSAADVEGRAVEDRLAYVVKHTPRTLEVQV